MRITFEVPADMEKKIREVGQHGEAEARQAYAITLFREGKLTHFELSRMLGLSRWETDGLLKRKGIFDHSLTLEDLARDAEVAHQFLLAAGK